MSLHKSLKSKNALVRRRNVLTRGERIEKLEERETWTEGQDSVFGLPKVKVRAAAKRQKGKKAEAEATPESEENDES